MSDNEETKIKNIQLYPTRTRLELNDKATKVLFEPFSKKRTEKA